MDASSFEEGQTWMWQGRNDPDVNWTLWQVLEVENDDWMLIVTLASGAQNERTDEVGFMYHMPTSCIMAVDSKRVA